MFADHQPIIEQYARQGTVEWTRVALMAVLSIQQHWYLIGRQLAEVERDGLSASALSWPNKRAAYLALTTRGEAIHNHYITATSREERVEIVRSIPGIGIAKAAFIVQLTTGESACLDMHNLARLGIYSNITSIRRYHQVIDDHGGSEVLWNDWCNYMAMRHPTIYTDGEHVSSLHLTHLGI